MSSKVMNMIGGLKNGTPIGPATSAARRQPRDRPMHGRKGVTIGQHLDEFDDFRDEQGRSFNELVYLLLFNEIKALAQPPPKPQVSEAGLSQKIKSDATDIIDRLKYAHLPELQKRMVPNPELKRKREEEYEQGKKAKVKTYAVEQGTAPRISISTDKDANARKAPNARRYF